jgi:predicted nucleotidyltransferase
LSLFGSTLKGTAGPDSDIDLLVEFERDAKPGLLDLANIENELSNLLGGRRVDLRTPEDLSRYSATKWFARRRFSMNPHDRARLGIFHALWEAAGVVG